MSASVKKKSPVSFPNILYIHKAIFKLLSPFQVSEKVWTGKYQEKVKARNYWNANHHIEPIFLKASVNYTELLKNSRFHITKDFFQSQMLRRQLLGVGFWIRLQLAFPGSIPGLRVTCVLN